MADQQGHIFAQLANTTDPSDTGFINPITFSINLIFGLLAVVILTVTFFSLSYMGTIYDSIMFFAHNFSLLFGTRADGTTGAQNGSIIGEEDDAGVGMMDAILGQGASPADDGHNTDILVQNIIDNVASGVGVRLGVPASQVHGNASLGGSHGLQNCTIGTGNLDEPAEAAGIMTFVTAVALFAMLFNLMIH